MNTPDAMIESKMQSAGIARPVINAFLKVVREALAGETGLSPESSIEPVSALPALAAVEQAEADHPDLLKKVAVVKLNGGLGTSMGLDRAKSLIVVKGAEAFLDLIARQILHLRQSTGSAEPLFYLMNSFSTQRDSLEHLRRHPALWSEGQLDFLQSKVPKLDAQTYEPARWPEEPELEWCPPGHGDFYPSLLASGLLDHLLNRGVRYLFVSNSDNLDATLEPALLGYFARSGLSFLMEVAERTPADQKGGHLARRRSDGRLILREGAQCPKEDQAHFQDIGKHRFFNTNNLWIQLEHLRVALERCAGALPLPLIKNVKNVDPRRPGSPRVVQLETAMGAAIQCFDRAGAIVVPRRRFAPVKTTAELLALRSDAYRVTEEYHLVLDDAGQGRPPVIELDERHYKVLADFERRFPHGPPSLAGCSRLKVSGDLVFEPGVVCRGTVELTNLSPETRSVPAGLYCDTSRQFRCPGRPDEA
jgi:UDP-N-acetylglucosamine pyrophosphorylase